MRTLEDIRSLSPQDVLQIFSSRITNCATCLHHKGKVLGYICVQCDLLMCEDCAGDLKHLHNPKQIGTKSSAASQHTQYVRSTQQVAVVFNEKCEMLAKTLQAKSTTVCEMTKASLRDIASEFLCIHYLISERRDKICKQVITEAGERESYLLSKLNYTQMEKESCRHAQSSLQFLLHSGTSHDVIASKDVVRKYQSILTSKWCQEELESTVSHVVTFDLNNEDVLLKVIKEFGVVVSGACPANCTVEPKPASINLEDSSLLKFNLKTSMSTNIHNSTRVWGDRVEALLRPKPPIPGPAIKARVVHDKDGTYDIDFPIRYTGECEVSVKVNGCNIEGSPFHIACQPGVPPSPLSIMRDSTDPTNHSLEYKQSCEKGGESPFAEPDVTCGHCKKELNNPYLLCCLHSVCAECLPNMVVENVRLKCSQCGDTSTAWNNGIMSESECRVDSVHCFPVPNAPLARYIEGMQVIHKVTSNFSISCSNKRCRSSDSTAYCTDCSRFLCERCYDLHDLADIYDGHIVKTLEEMQTLGTQDIHFLSPKVPMPITCQRHKGKILEYCCELCNVLMCQACAVDCKSPHSPVFLDDSVSCPFAKAIKIACQAAVCFEEKCEKIEKQIRVEIKSFNKLKKDSLCNVNVAFQNIAQALDERKKELVANVSTVAEEKQFAINSSLTTAEEEKTTVANMQASLQFLLNNSSSCDGMAISRVAQCQQIALTSKWFVGELERSVPCTVTFDTHNKDVLLKAIEEYCIVTHGACPGNCTVEPKPESVQWNGSDPVTLTVTTFDRENIRCKRGGDNAEAFLHPKSPIPGPAIKAKVSDEKDGRYTISFPNMYPGKCNLYIHMNGKDIKGSGIAVDLVPNTYLSRPSKSKGELGAIKRYLPYPLGWSSLGYCSST